MTVSLNIESLLVLPVMHGNIEHEIFFLSKINFDHEHEFELQKTLSASSASCHTPVSCIMILDTSFHILGKCSCFIATSEKIRLITFNLNSSPGESWSLNNINSCIETSYVRVFR